MRDKFGNEVRGSSVWSRDHSSYAVDDDRYDNMSDYDKEKFAETGEGGTFYGGGGGGGDDGCGGCGCLVLILILFGLFGGDCGQNNASNNAVQSTPVADGGASFDNMLANDEQKVGPFDLAARAGEQTTLVINGVEFTFIWCPPGEFEMGSPVSEPGRYDWENRRRVTLTSGFWLLAVETTQEMWRAGNGSSSATTLEPYTGARKPASNVSWFDCQEFVESLNASGFAPKGWRFALPTEAQWEYACRAGSTDMYSPSGAYGNLSECCWYDDPQGAPRDVARKFPNAWGFYDMHGNVYEWCGDWFAESYCGTTVDPSGPTTGTYRVLRGGAWGSEARHCRSANRYSYLPESRVYSHGFRLALVRDGE